MKNLTVLFLLAFFINCFQTVAQTTHSGKRLLLKTEEKQLAAFKDSLLNELKLLYVDEVKQNAPGKNQPQRIALVRDYLLLFAYVQEQKDIIHFTESSIIRILGKPDKISIENNTKKYHYQSINKPYLRLKNFNHTLYFYNNELVELIN